MDLRQDERGLDAAQAGVRRRRATAWFASTAAIASLGLSTPALAHHGLGRFDRTKESTSRRDQEHRLREPAFVSLPRCRHRGRRHHRDALRDARRHAAAPLGLVEGNVHRRRARPRSHGFAHREDPASCYLEDITIGTRRSVNRNDQIESAVDTRAAAAPAVRRAEHLGRLGAGTIRDRGPPAAQRRSRAEEHGRGRRSRHGRAEQTSAGGLGREAGDAHGARQGRGRRISDVAPTTTRACAASRPASSSTGCSTARSTASRKSKDRIVINYGLFSYERVIHMNMAEHPAEHQAELRRPLDRPLGRRRARRRHDRFRARRHRAADAPQRPAARRRALLAGSARRGR